MTAPVKTPKTLAELGAHNPGGDAFAFPVFPDVMSGWMSLATANVQTWQSEWTNFIARRMEQDRLAMQRFASCRDILEVAKVQQDWFAETMAEYLSESRRLAAIAAEPAKTPAAKTKLTDVA
jgi:hypothetical protein